MLKQIKGKISKVLSKDERVIFAYLFCSFLKGEDFNDIDVGIHCIPSVLQNPFSFTSDIKIELSRSTGIPPDRFDIALINCLFDSDRIDSLLVLGEIFDGQLIIDRDPALRTELIERASAQFRESAGILQKIY